MFTMLTQLGSITFPEGLAGEIVSGIEGTFYLQLF